MTDPIGVNEAAEIMGIHPSGVTRYCQQGRLVAEKLGKRPWMIERQSAIDFVPNPSGNPEFQARKAKRKGEK